jgi:signal transduction histidine kinase
MLHDAQLQQQLEHTESAREEAERALQIKSEFLANMSHELRTPMHAILNFAKLSLKNLSEEEAHQKSRGYLQKIHQSGGRLLRLINNLLDLSKMEAGKMEYHFKTTNFSAIAEQSISELASLLEHKRMMCVVEKSADEVVVVVDAERMVQVLVNLLGNAVKFSSEDSEIKVIIRLMDDVDAGVQVLYCAVEDHGVGIPDGEYDSVFHAFSQSSLTDSKSGGTGLGLSICKQIIHAHHGRIWAEPASGGGACFCFAVPSVL